MTNSSGLNLGEVLKALWKMPPNAKLRVMAVGIEGVGSYRGYYDHLAIEPGGKPGTVAEAVTELQGAIGKTFQGYKGGDYTMTQDTPVWVSHYGEASGHRVVDVVLSGTSGDVSVLTEERDW